MYDSVAEGASIGDESGRGGRQGLWCFGIYFMPSAMASQWRNVSRK